MCRFNDKIGQYLSMLLVFSLLLTACTPVAQAVTLRPEMQQQPADDNANGKLYLPAVTQNHDLQAPTPTPPPTSPLQLNPIGNQIAKLGVTLKFTLSASNPNGGALTYSVAPLPLPANVTFHPTTGQFSFKPDLSQVGEFALTFSASNGAQNASETIKINVPQPPTNGDTTLSGRILDANEAAAGREVPLVGATVRLMKGAPMSTTTASDGSFSLVGLPEGEQYLEYDGSTASSSVAPAGSYGAYRGQKVIIAHVDNEIERPIYIMKIDMAGKTTVNPNAQTVVSNPNISVMLTIKPQTVLNDQGQIYASDISVSPVPTNFTPASLPDNLNPGRVVTIQPMGLTFQQAAPVRFPNNDGLAANSIVNIWSMDHKLGKFFIAGKGQVSGDGKWIDTIEGGIRESSWHFVLPVSPSLSTVNEAPGDNNRICRGNLPQNAAANASVMASTVRLADGCIESSIQLPSYFSLGATQQLEFNYLSQRAWPVPILPFQATLPVQAAVPQAIQYELRSFGGVNGGNLGQGYISPADFKENQDEAFRGAIAIGSSAPNNSPIGPFVAPPQTGIYPWAIRLTNHYGNSAVSADLNGRYPVVNEQNSAFGAGWGLAGLQRIYPQPNNTLFLTEGGGSSQIFNPDVNITLGSFDPTRGGSYGFKAGLNYVSARSALAENFPSITYVDFGEIKPENLQNADLIILNPARENTQAITPLSDAEKDALLDFVKSGRCAILFAEHINFAPDSSRSLVGPFGLDFTGEIGGIQSVAVAVPTSHAITNGPFGLVFSFLQNRTGGFTKLGPYARSLATNVFGSALAVIDPSAIAPGSGGVVLFSDGNMFDEIGGSFATNKALFLNTISFCTASKRNSTAQYKGPDGDFSIITKDNSGNFIRRLKDGTLYTFNASGLQTALTDRNGNTTHYAYDANNRLTSITDPAGLITTLTYNGAHLQSVTDPTKRTTTFEHNAVGDLVKVSFPDGSNQQFGYDNHHLMTSEIDPRGQQTTRQYDAYGRLVSANLPEGVTRSTAYAQKVGLVTDPNVGTTTNPAPVVRPTEVKTTVTDGENRTTTYTFGPIQSIASFIDPAQLKTTIDRDQASNPTKFTYPSGQVINQSFDGGGNLLSVNDPTVQGTTNFSYEPLFNQPVTIKDPFNNVTNLTYDAKGNPIQIASPLNRTVRMAYNTQGLPVVVTDTLGAVANFGYDGKGNLTQLAWGGGATARNASFAYTEQGYLQSMNDPLGRSFGYQYDPVGRLTNETLPGSRTVSYQYDKAGNLTSLTPPSRPAHQFEYNGLGLLSAYIPPTVDGVSNPRTSYTYNKAQQLIQLARPDGLAVNYSYDNAGRLAEIQFSRGSVKYSYNATTGQLATISAPDNVNLGLQYRGDLLTGESWSGALNGNVQRNYDAGYRTQSIIVNGAAVNYQYDQDSAPVRVGDLTLSYQPASGLLANTTLGGVNDSFSYNSFGELQGYTANSGVTPLFQTSYTRDALGRITGLTETIINTTTVYGYSYDTAGRLVQVTSSRGQPASYTYDANGNRLSATDGNGTRNGNYDNQDRLLSYGATSYTYTANGELKTKTSNGQQTSYSYDEFGNLTSVALPTVGTITYLIDGQDRRIGKKVNGVLQKGWLYEDQLRPVAEVDGSGAVVSRFVYATRVNVPDYMVKAGKTYRLVLDHLGSVRLVVNVQNGGVVQLLDYDAWGMVTRDTNPGFQPFGFAGGLYDAQTGLVRFGARDYDAGVGRWTAKDPIGFGGGDGNFYSYVGGEPMGNTDESGMARITVCKDTKEVTLQDDNGNVIFKTDVVTGCSGHDTPSGEFQAGHWIKDKTSPKYGPVPWSENNSNPYGPWFLPINQNGRYTSLGIHGTAGPGWSWFETPPLSQYWSSESDFLSCSHGCVRLSNRAITKLHDLLENSHGTPIRIQNCK